MNAPSAPQAMQTSELPLDKIVPSGTHIQTMRRQRFDKAMLHELANSIKEVGVLQAVVVRPDPGSSGDRYELVAGERRWLAAKDAGLVAIPATIRALTDEQVLKAQLVENLQREGLHPLEEAEGYDELMKLEKISADQVATMIGKSRSYVFARLKLLGLDLDGRKAFYAGDIDASRALYVARIANPKLQTKALKLATEKGWKAGELRYSVRSLREQLTGHGFSVPLATAPFNTTDSTFVQMVKVRKGVEETRPLPDCDACPNRTGNCLDLFTADDDPDVCMEPACYDAKVRQFGERARLLAEASGIKVITGEEARKIAPTKNDLAGYIDLDHVCDDDEYPEEEPEYPRKNRDDPAVLEAYDKAQDEWQTKADQYRSRTFRELLAGTEVSPVVIEDPRDHRIRTLVPFEEAEKLLKKQHKIDLADWRHGVNGGRMHSPSETAADKEARLHKEEAQRARQEEEGKFRRELLQQVEARASAPLKRDDLDLIATKLLGDYQTNEAAEKFYGKELHPGQMKEPALLSLIRVLTVVECIDVHDQPGALLDLARRLKIDPDKIKKELKATAKTAEKPEKKAAPKKAKKSR